MPKRIDPVLQRRAIAEAALDVIDASGLEGARLRDVAAAADLTTGAVTHYFDGKDAVLLAAMDEIVRRILEKQTDAVRGATLAETAALFLPLTAESRREWRAWLAFWGRAIADETLRKRHRAYYAEITGRLAHDLRALRPTLSAAEATATADALVAAIDGVGTRATLEPEDWPPARQRDVLTRLIGGLLND
jgi:TetR/AcrR family transcriptional regulator, transcriptional repressor of bet genes